MEPLVIWPVFLISGLTSILYSKNCIPSKIPKAYFLDYIVHPPYPQRHCRARKKWSCSKDKCTDYSFTDHIFLQIIWCKILLESTTRYNLYKSLSALVCLDVRGLWKFKIQLFWHHMTKRLFSLVWDIMASLEQLFLSSYCCLILYPGLLFKSSLTLL